MGLALAVLIALQVVPRLWPLLLLAGAGFVAYRVSGHHSVQPTRPPKVLQGQVVTETCVHGVPYPCGICDGASSAVDHGEFARLRSDNEKLRTKVRVLSDMINGPDARP
jgi:hypothetical protein